MAKTLSGLTLPWTIWKRTGVFRHISFSKGMTLFSDDLVKHTYINNEDAIFQGLKTAATPLTILKLIDQNYKTMNSKHVVQALKSVYYMEKSGRNVSSAIGTITKHSGFEKLCRRLKFQSGLLDLNDIVESLKILSYVKVPSNSTITQILLQLLRHNVNSLNIQQILFLDFLLSGFQPSPLVNALKIALPLAFDIHLPHKMDRRNVSHMAECLQYASKHNLNWNTLRIIVNGLEKIPDEFNAQIAKNIIWSLCHMPKSDTIEKLYRKSITDLSVNFDLLTDRDIDLTLHKMAHQYSNTYPFYYSEVFFDISANHCIENNLGLQRCVSILRHTARLHHFHKNLLDYVSKLIDENPSEICTASDCYGLVIALILSDYKPIYFDSLIRWIRGAKHLAAENKKEIIWLRFAAALCMLDIYKVDVLSRALNRNYLEHLLNKGFLSDYEHYFLIWKSITIYKPDLIDLLPSNLDPKDLVKNIKHPQSFPLQAALEEGLGGEQFLLTNVHSKFGDIIDHALIYCKDGNLVSIPKHVKFIEDISLRQGDQLVLVWALKDYNYTRNTKMLRASIIISINLLERTLNCHVIPIHLDTWLELIEPEKIPYLMQKIKEKINIDLDISKNVICE